LRVEEHGRGPAVLLAHGMWCDAGMFARLTADLARDHRVIVPDLRAHGGSEVPAAAWSVADLADDLVAILDELDVPRVILAGFSMGGMAAVDFAVRYPRRLTGLALMGTSAASEELMRGAQIRALARLIDLTGQSRFLAREASRTNFSAGFRRADPTEVRRWESTVRAMSRQALAQALRAVAGRPDLLQRLDEVRVPAVVMTGGADAVVRPRWSQAMQRHLPRSRLVVYPGVGHAVPNERPGEVAALLRELDAVGPGRGP
jgi:pimeloyl-ACP methyl ester carboxylesterase